MERKLYLSDSMPLSFLPPFADTSFIAAFVLIFAIVYAMLSKSSVINLKGANVAIAAVIGFFAATFQPLTQFLQSILPIAAILLVILFFLMFARDILGKGGGDKLPAMVVLVASLILVAVLWDRIVANLPAGLESNSLLWTAGVVIIILIFYLAYKHTGSQ